MKSTIHILVVTVLAILMTALLVVAQSDNTKTVERLRAELDRTDQIIERAEPLVRASESRIVINALDRARDIQANAREEFAKGNTAGYIAARRFTLVAREQVALALKLVGGTPGGNTEQQDDFVLRKLEQTTGLLDRALESLTTVDNRSLVALADAARSNLDKAWEFYRNQQYRPALKLAEQVERAAEKILAAATRGEQREQGFERLSANVAHLIDQARQQLADCDSETGRAFLAEAEQAFRLAQEMHEKQRTPASVQALQRARELAMKAGRECRGLDRLQERHDKLAAELNRLKSDVTIPEGAAGETMRRLLAQTEEQLALANQHIGDGDWRKAALALQAAQLAIRQAKELTGQTG